MTICDLPTHIPFRLPYLTVPSLPKYQNVGCRFSFLLVTLTTSSMAGELRRTFFRSCLSLGLVWNSQSCHIIQSFTRRKRGRRRKEIQLCVVRMWNDAESISLYLHVFLFPSAIKEMTKQNVNGCLAFFENLVDFGVFIIQYLSDNGQPIISTRNISLFLFLGSLFRQCVKIAFPIVINVPWRKLINIWRIIQVFFKWNNLSRFVEGNQRLSKIFVPSSLAAATIQFQPSSALCGSHNVMCMCVWNIYIVLKWAFSCWWIDRIREKIVEGRKTIDLT